jgi:hypothetical protein
MTLKDWLKMKDMSLIEFEHLSGVPYQRISAHLRENKPLSEEHVAKILKTTNGQVSAITLRPKLEKILKELDVA